MSGVARDEKLAQALWECDFIGLDSPWAGAREHEREGYLRKAVDFRVFLSELGMKVVNEDVRSDELPAD